MSEVVRAFGGHAAENMPVVNDISVSPTAGWNPTVRNRHLVRLSKALDSFDRAEGINSRQRDMRSAREKESVASRRLANACGDCILSQSCHLAFDIRAWRLAHPAQAHSISTAIETRGEFVADLQSRPGRSC